LTCFDVYILAYVFPDLSLIFPPAGRLDLRSFYILL